MGALLGLTLREEGPRVAKCKQKRERPGALPHQQISIMKSVCILAAIYPISSIY